MIMPFLIGVGLTLALLLVSLPTGLAREKGVYPTLLISIALFYVVFALQTEDHHTIIFNILIASLFALIALIGYRISFTLIAFGLILHGVFDVVYAAIGGSPAPDWWGPFCLAVDILLGLFLFFMVKKKKLT